MSLHTPDLTQFPPRSPRVRLGGYAILPRMLDKGRATVAKAGAQGLPGRGRLVHYDGARKISEVLIPPNAKLLFMAMVMGPWRALPST